MIDNQYATKGNKNSKINHKYQKADLYFTYISIHI